jgi:hypothetical protein
MSARALPPAKSSARASSGEAVDERRVHQ